MNKTFIRIVLITVLLVFCTLLPFSVSAGKMFQNVITKMTYEKTVKELDIIADTITGLHDNAKNYVFTLMSDTSMDTILRTGTMQDSTGYYAMLDLANTIKVNPAFHSISLYSGYRDEYFSTLTSKAKEDEYFRNVVENNEIYSILTPLCRKLSPEVYYQSAIVFSYIYYETDSNNQVTKAICVNLNAQWLCNYLNRLKGNNAKAYIIDRKHEIFIDGSTNIYSSAETDLEFIKKVAETGNEVASFTSEEGEHEKLITCRWMDNPDWILVVEEPNNEFYSSLTVVRLQILEIALLVLLLGIIISFFASRQLYNPWKKLYQKVNGILPQKISGRKFYDVVGVINDSLELTQQQLKEYSHYRNSSENILLETYIRALLREDVQAKDNMSPDIIARFSQMFSQPVFVIVFRIDHWSQLKACLPQTRDLCGYTLLRLSQTLISSDENRIKWVYLGSGRYLLLAFQQQREEQEGEKQIRELQQQFCAETSFTVSITIGGLAEGAEMLNQTYQKALDLLRYSILFEPQCILTSQIIDDSSDTLPEYDETLEKSLLDAICGYAGQEAQRLFDVFLHTYAKTDLHGFLLYLSRLFLTIGRRVEAMNKIRVDKIPVSIQNLYQKLSEFESLADIRKGFADELLNLEQNVATENEKHSTLVESVMSYIDAHYMEEIGLKGISADFKFSPGYLGALFKEHTGYSVLEYTNEIRLKKAEELICKTSLSMVDIMKKSGFNNESNFYKLFKKKYGVTPKSYQLNQIVTKQ